MHREKAQKNHKRFVRRMQKNLIQTQTTKKITNHKIKTYTDTKSISNNLGAFGVC